MNSCDMALVGLILMALFSVSYSFEIQGSWRLVSADGLPVLPQAVSLQIEDYIFRQSQIQQRVTISGCMTYRYVANFVDNNIFLNYNTFELISAPPSSSNGTQTSECSAASQILHTLIRNHLRKAFYFQIFGSYLQILDPENRDILRFERSLSTRIKNIRGVWLLARLNSQPKSLAVNIADNEISLCQGKLKMGYILEGKWGIRVRILEDTGCPQKDLSQVMLSSKFYRRKGNKELSVLDEALNEIMYLQYVGELDLKSIALQKQQAIEQAKQVQQQNSLATAEATQKQQQQGSVQVSSSSNVSPSTLTNTVDDLIGLWQPTEIFGTPLDSTPVYLMFTRDQIVYNGGCNSFIFQYQANAQNSQITIGRNRSSSKTCQTNDDGLYVSGIAKMDKYSLSVASGGQIKLRIMDTQGTTVYELKKKDSNAKVSSGSNTPTTQTKIPQPQSQPQPKTTPINPFLIHAQSQPSNSTLAAPLDTNSFREGRYVLLLINRRDLPRKLVRITPNTITYNGCNKIQQSYEIPSSGKLSITGSITGNNNCASDNDKVMLDTFNSAKQFIVGQQKGSYRLRDAQGIDIINLSQS